MARVLQNTFVPIGQCRGQRFQLSPDTDSYVPFRRGQSPFDRTFVCLIHTEDLLALTPPQPIATRGGRCLKWGDGRGMKHFPMLNLCCYSGD